MTAAAWERSPSAADIGAPATLLATGGMAALWERTTNPPGAVGDGALLAWRAGAALADLELVQFHPTVLARGGLLLSEALRGEGALLLDGGGSRFTDELAPRDVVARADSGRGERRCSTCARSTARASPRYAHASPTQASIRPRSRCPSPRRPTTRWEGSSPISTGAPSVPGLYAAGECACTGVHGANRLASNSLLECLVFGRRAALAAHTRAGPAQPPPDRHRRPSPCRPSRRTLRRALWEHAGLVRDAAGLETLREQPHPLARLVAEAALGPRGEPRRPLPDRPPRRGSGAGGPHRPPARAGARLRAMDLIALPTAELARVVETALAEDLGPGDDDQQRALRRRRDLSRRAAAQGAGRRLRARSGGSGVPRPRSGGRLRAALDGR